jgi:hypothetical protein
MTNPYLDRLRSQIGEKGHPQQPSKPSKPGYDGFEGDLGCPVFENLHPTATKNTTPGYSQNRQNLAHVLAVLESRCPDHVPVERWLQAVKDGGGFLAIWSSQAEALGWTTRDLFGLAPVPDRPHPSYSRLSRYDQTGLIWLLQGREVVALTADTATIRNPATSTVTVYRRHNKPALGPLGDSLDDFE